MARLGGKGNGGRIPGAGCCNALLAQPSSCGFFIPAWSPKARDQVLCHHLAGSPCCFSWASSLLRKPPLHFQPLATLGVLPLASLSSPWEDSSFVSVVICYLLLLISVLPEKQHRAMAPRARDSATGSTPFLICASTAGGKSRGRETEPGGGAAALRGKWPQAL